MNTITTALSGLEAASKRLQASASNVANMSTAGSLDDGAQQTYTPIRVQQSTQVSDSNGPTTVRTDFTPIDQPFVPAFDPDSPFANEDGLIGFPNVNLANEAVNMALAELSYKANISVIEAAEENSNALLDIFDDD